MCSWTSRKGNNTHGRYTTKSLSKINHILPDSTEFCILKLERTNFSTKAKSCTHYLHKDWKLNACSKINI